MVEITSFFLTMKVNSCDECSVLSNHDSLIIPICDRACIDIKNPINVMTEAVPIGTSFKIPCKPDAFVQVSTGNLTNRCFEEMSNKPNPVNTPAKPRLNDKTNIKP